jgi:hexosaminidase
METVIDEFIKMYQEAGLELKVIHMGGDELPKGAWEGSPSIQKLMKDENIATVNLVWPYYVKRILEIADKKGIKVAGWEELGMVNDGKGMKPNPQFSKDDLQLDVWNNVIGGGNEDLAYRLANAGYPVVFTSANNFYFDFAWSDNYNEPGHNWAGYIDLEKSYGFMVHNFLRNLPDNIAAKRQALTAEGKKNIIGIKGALWAEKIADSSRLEYMLVPRIFALAERAWAQEPEWEKPSQTNWKALYQQDWSRFANIIGLKEIPRLEKRWKGVNYKLPSIGVKEINGEVVCNLELPGFYIVYTSDGSEPQANGKKYTQPIQEKGTLKFKVFNSSGRGSYTTTYLNK